MRILEKNVIYDEPDVLLLNASNHICVDMHTHTKYSDGVNSVPAVLRHAKKLGIGIAITDHNCINGAIYAKQLIKNKKEFQGLLLIPGIEVTVKEGYHILAYFSSFEDLTQFYIRAIRPFLTRKAINTNTNIIALDMIKVAREYDSLLFLAHPFVVTGVFVSAKDDPSEVVSEVDGFEVINACIPENANLQAIRWFSNFEHRNFCAGSDSHFNPLTGSALTLVDINKVKTAKDFIEEIRNKNHRVIGKSVTTRDLALNHLFFYRLLWNKIRNMKVVKKISS